MICGRIQWFKQSWVLGPCRISGSFSDIRWYLFFSFIHNYYEWTQFLSGKNYWTTYINIILLMIFWNYYFLNIDILSLDDMLEPSLKVIKKHMLTFFAYDLLKLSFFSNIGILLPNNMLELFPKSEQKKFKCYEWSKKFF